MTVDSTLSKEQSFLSTNTISESTASLEYTAKYTYKRFLFARRVQMVLSVLLVLFGVLAIKVDPPNDPTPPPVRGFVNSGESQLVWFALAPPIMTYFNSLFALHTPLKSKTWYKLVIFFNDVGTVLTWAFITNNLISFYSKEVVYTGLKEVITTKEWESSRVFTEKGIFKEYTYIPGWSAIRLMRVAFALSMATVHLLTSVGILIHYAICHRKAKDENKMFLPRHSRSNSSHPKDVESIEPEKADTYDLDTYPGEIEMENPFLEEEKEEVQPPESVAIEVNHERSTSRNGDSVAPNPRTANMEALLQKLDRKS